MANEISAVLEFGAPEPGETATKMEDKLRFHTDSWDLSVDLKAALADIVGEFDIGEQPVGARLVDPAGVENRAMRFVFIEPEIEEFALVHSGGR
jgi:hypothetical protein